MKKNIERLNELAKKLIPPFLCLFVFILIMKQLGLYDWILQIYKSCVPVLMGVVIAFLLQPLIDKLKGRFSTKVSVIIVYVAIILIAVLFLVLMIPILYEQIVDFAKVIPSWITKLEALLNKYHIVYGNLGEIKQKYLQEGYVIVVDSLMNTFNVATKYGIAFITAFFISIDLDFWKRTGKKIIPNIDQFSTFYRTMSNIVYQYLVGTFIDLLFITISVSIVLTFFDFPNAILYAVILALLNLFPYVGASVGLVLIAVVGALSYPTFPIICFGIVWIIQQVEANFIQPMIFNRTMNVRPILTFVFIFISDAFFGVVGVILSPIFASIAQIGFRSYLHSKTSEKVGEWEDIWYDFDEIIKDEALR